MKSFLKKKEALLLQKKTALFICGMHTSKNKQEKELEVAYPKVLQNKAEASAFLGGAFIFEKMNFFERFIIKKIAKTSTSFMRIDENALEKFIEKIS
jgi:menaquinone-dependent protoporphyrinogen oxidase